MIGLISALTGKDIVGDLNSGSIIDGNGLGGIIGGSGSSTETGSSSEVPGTSSENGSSSGNDYIYKEEGVYYKDDLDLKWYYSDTLTNANAVYFEFYVPVSESYFWTVELSRPKITDSAMGFYSYNFDINDNGEPVITDGIWYFCKENVFSAMEEDLACSKDGKMIICYATFESYPTTDEGIKELVESCMYDDFVLKVYPTPAKG